MYGFEVMTLVAMGQMMGECSCLSWGKGLGPQRDTWGKGEKGEEAEDRIQATADGKTGHALRGGSRTGRDQTRKER